MFPPGRVAYAILHPTARCHRLGDGFLRTCNGGTDRAYAYLLVDHLRWLEFESLSPGAVTMRDLSRYMAAVGAEYAGPYGRPWRAGKEPYSQSSLDSAAACLERFYQFQGTQGANQGLAGEPGPQAPARQGRPAADVPGARGPDLPANPLRPAQTVQRRHPKMLAEGAREKLVDDLRCAAKQDDRDMAERRRVPGRRAVRAALGRPAPAGEVGLRRLRHAARSHLPPEPTRTGAGPRPSIRGLSRTATCRAGRSGGRARR